MRLDKSKMVLNASVLRDTLSVYESTEEPEGTLWVGNVQSGVLSDDWKSNFPLFQATSGGYQGLWEKWRLLQLCLNWLGLAFGRCSSTSLSVFPVASGF